MKINLVTSCIIIKLLRKWMAEQERERTSEQQTNDKNSVRSKKKLHFPLWTMNHEHWTAIVCWLVYWYRVPFVCVSPLSLYWCGVVSVSMRVSQCVWSVHTIKSQETNIWPTFCFHVKTSEKKNSFRHTHCHTSFVYTRIAMAVGRERYQRYLHICFVFSSLSLSSSSVYYYFPRSPDFITFEHDNEKMKKIAERKEESREKLPCCASLYVVCHSFIPENHY